MKIYPVIIILITVVSFSSSFSTEQDTLHILTHNKTKVITDPSKGFNAYKSWNIFPPENIKYRKVILYVTYQCPDSQRCGEWDYIDNIFLRRKGSVNDSSMDIELARIISPYGSRFTPDWKFKWKSDITDFSFLLHDSVEIEFNHTGYESNTDRGWLITLDFEFTIGNPVMESVGFQKLWNGSFPYGNDTDKIENYLLPIKFSNDKNADIARLRILQTGHGMDDFENCAEFCSKYRKIILDDNLIEQKQIWRECGDNPLYPQAGTWIFDRAGWCPGAIVNPDVYDFNVSDNNEHTIDIQMEPYVNPSNPSANYVFSSYLFFYKKPVLKNDISIEEIISPSAEDIYSRQNPICMSPVISIRNNGLENISKVNVNYGLESDVNLNYEWNGNLEYGKSEKIILPGIISARTGRQNFFVNLICDDDEYLEDNYKISSVDFPAIFDPKFVVLIKTNNDTGSNYFQILNSAGQIINNWNTGKLNTNTLYSDTFDLKPGCYELAITDTANDGLDFWFNPEGGYGYVRVVDMNGKLIRSFNSDFGSEIRQQFIVTGEKGFHDSTSAILNIFPIRNPGKFFSDIFLNDKQNITLQITTEDKKKIVYETKLKKFKDGMIDIDISKEPDGFYYVNLITQKETITKRMKLKKD